MQEQPSINPITLVILAHLHLTKARRSSTFLFFCGSGQHDPRPYPKNNLLTGDRFNPSEFVLSRVFKKILFYFLSVTFIVSHVIILFVKQMSIHFFSIRAFLTFYLHP